MDLATVRARYRASKRTGRLTPKGWAACHAKANLRLDAACRLAVDEPDLSRAQAAARLGMSDEGLAGALKRRFGSRSWPPASD